MSVISAHALFLALAFAIECAVGYPPALERRLGHPIAGIGWLIAWAERRFNRPALPPRRARAWGVGVVAGLLLFLLVPALLLSWLGQRGGLAGSAALGGLASSLLATRLLARRVADVAAELRAGRLEGARAALGHLVGRDVAELDAAGVGRAAIESLAENFSDAVIAPLFWGLLFGLPGILLYKAANTADSMLGHRTPRLLHFGWAAARLDDALNLIPARLSGLLLAAAALPGAGACAALRTMRRDAPRHRSPNAGWPEAAMAGALGLALGGPRRYGGVAVREAWLGRGRREAAASDIEAALRLYGRACGLAAAGLFLLALPALLSALGLAGGAVSGRG